MGFQRVEGPGIPLARPHEPYGPTFESPRIGAAPGAEGLESLGSLREVEESATETRVDRADPFGTLLEGAIASANRQGLTAADAAREFAAGRRDDIHGTMIALSKADIELRLVGNVRNKVVEAFYELWRMQV